MKRVIILDGPDGGGKTTLADALAPRIRAVQINHGPYPEIILPTLWLKYFYSMLPAYAGLHNVILDRAWPAEPIYGAAFRGGKTRITPWQRRILERIALGLDAVFVLALPPFETCLAAWAARKGREYLEKAEQLRAVWEGYFALSRGGYGMPLQHYWYDRTGPLSLERALDHLADETNWSRNAGPGVGSWSPRSSVLIVGERPGGVGGPFAPAFCGTSPTGVSAWLADRLEAAEISESELYWINAYAGPKDDCPTPPYFVEELEPKAVFLLGRAASAWWEKNFTTRTKVFEFDHPQYWKRFHHHEPYPLIATLKKEVENV